MEIEEKIKKYRELQAELQTLEMDIKGHFKGLEDPVKGLAEYIKFMQYPTELYHCSCIDGGDYDDYDDFNDVVLKVVYQYDYTDVVGLSEEEFIRLQKLLEP